MEACFNGHEGTAKLLLINGADINLCDKNGNNPLRAAYFNRDESTIKQHCKAFIGHWR